MRLHGGYHFYSILSLEICTKETVLPLLVSVQQQLVLSLDMSFLHMSVLPSDVSVSTAPVLPLENCVLE